MFETLVTGVLTNVMGNFIDPKCFSSDKISVAVWSGYVVLRDLELKPEVVAHPSVNLVRGVVGSIELKIPWNRLQSESVVLTVDDVYLLVHTEADIEAVLMEMDEFTIKKQLLEQLYAEAKKKQVAEQQDTAHRAKDDGFTARLVNKIIDNIELHIRRIHVRLEDHVTGDHPFAVGLTIESVHAQSTNSNWQPSYVDSSKNSEPRIYKMVELNHLSVYLDPHCEVLRNQRIDFKSCPLEDFCRAFNHSIPKRFDDRHPLQLYPTHQRHHFILKPVDSSARLIVNRDPSDLTIPKFEVDINVAEIGIRLEESQYCDLLYLASAFQVPEHHKKYQQYRKFRPRLSVFDSSATEWWQYAINAIIDDNRKKKLRWSWKYMKERRDDRIRYIQLWMRQIRRLELGPNQSNLLVDSDEETDEDDSGAPTSGALRTDSSNTSMHSRAQVDMTELEAIERKRPIEDIILFRYLADKKLDEDDYTSDSDTSEQQQMPMPPFSDSESVDTEATDSTLPTEKRYRSWGKWMFGWTSRVGVAPSPTDSSVSKRNFPEVELRELFKLVEYEPSKKAKKRRVAELAYPSEQNSLDEGDISDLVSRVTLTLGKGSITLSSDPETNKRLTRDDPNYAARYAPTDFLLGSFSHLQVAAITKADSTRVDVSLQTIDAFDESADSMAFSRLLTRKQDRAMSSTDDDGGLLSANRMAGPIFLMSYETNPVGVAADAALYVHMEPLEIVFSPTARCWGRLGSFLNTPQVLGLWAELEVASFNDIVNLKARTEAKLHYVMANRVALSVDLRIQAPLVVIPQSDSDYNCSRMVIDLGHINFRTDRLSKLDSETASLSASQTGGFSTGATPSSLVLSTPYNSPQLTSSMSFVRQLYDDAEKGEGAIRWKEEFYDKFTLSVTNVHVILIPHGKAASGQFFKNGLRVPTSSALNGNALPSPDWELVERFNINVTLRTSVLPLDATLTRFYVHADLPALTFNMSLEKYFQLLALVERFGTSAPPLDMPSGMKSIQSMSRSFLDRDGTFITGPGEQFLSSTGMNPDSGDHFNSRKMELHDLIDGDKSGSEELSDAESDDTWFSITSGTVDLPFSGLDETRDQYSLELDTFVLDSGEKNTAAPQSGGARSRLQNSPTRTRERKHGRRGSMTLPSGDLIDRRLFVCSFTVPVIAIQLKKPTPVSVPPSSYRFDHSGIFEDDTPESGTLILKVEGFRVRIAKKTLSTQVDVQIRSLDVEDFVEVGGRSSEYLLFSCPAISAPFDLLAPPRRSFPYAASGGSRRKVSRQRERVISVQNGPGPSLGGSLLELGFGSQCDRQTSCEVSREISVRFGAVHLVCDQSYVCSLLELFEESWYKVSQSSNVTAADDDGDEDFVDAIPPPPDLTSSVTQEFSLPVILTDSVLADLERARNEFIAQEQSVLKSNAPNAAPIALTIGVQLQSVSILFSDRGDAVTSMAIVGTKLRMTRGVQGTTGINIRGAIQDIKLFDLSSARDVSGLGEKDGIPRKSYVEIFGLEQEALASGDKVVELDATINKHFDQSDADAEGTSDAEVMVRSRLAVRVQPVQLQVQSAFVESIANYIIHGSVAARFIAREDIPVGTGLHRRHKRTESLSAEPQRAYHQRVQQHQETDILTPPASTPMQPSPKIPRGGRFSFGLDIVVELLHPSIIIACGQGYSESDEAVVIDLGAITIKAGRDDALDSNRDVSTDGYLVVLVNGALVATRSDHTKVLEETTIRVEVGNEHRSTDEFGRQSLPRRVNIALSPVKLNIGERYLCLALDLWNDVIDPTIQVIDNTVRSPLFSRRKRANADVELATSSPSGWLVVEMAIESLHIVMVSKHNPDFEGWLKTTMEAAEPHLARDPVLGGVTNAGSPRRRRHNFSFAQEETGFRSVTTAPTLAPIAEIVLSNVVGSLDIGGCGSDSSHREQRFAGRLSIHELSIQDLVSDSSEFMSGILAKVPDRNARENPDPQLQVNFSYKLVVLPEDRDPERVISCSVLMSSARLCILPRTLLRIENYAVTVAVSLAQKLAHQDPRIISTVDQQSTALALADPSTGSLGTDLSASQERVVKYGSVRVRKNSLGDSMRESAITCKQKDIEETITCSDGPATQLRSKFAWTVRAELSEFQIWLLSSDRERDSFGLCLSSRFVVDCEKPVEFDSSKLDASSSKSDNFYVAAKATGIRVHLGSPTDETMQSYELIEPVTVALNLSAIKHHRPTLDDSADVSLSAIPVNASWDVWRSINSTLSVTAVSSRLAYKDLPVILRIVSAVSALSGAEAHVRSPLASIAAHDPYLELSELDTDGDDRSVVDQDKNILSHIPHVVEIAVDVDILKFRLINNLVDEDSPVVGFRVGPLHVSLKDVTDFGTDINGSCSLEAWYHNLRLVASEPLIEPWSFTLTCAQDRANYKSSVSTRDFEAISFREAAPWKVTISSAEFFQWNVTDALITNIMAASRAWEWMSRGAAIDSSDRSEYSTYWIRNETGLTLRYWGPACRDNVMSPGAEEPLLFTARSRSKSGEYSFGDSESDQFIGRQLYIAVEDGDECGKFDQEREPRKSVRRWESEFAIPVDQADSRLYALVDLDADLVSSRVRKCECVIDVLVERGIKVFVVRSTLVLENNTASDLEIEYVPPLRRTASPPFRAGAPRGHLIPSWKAVVAASSTLPVPVNLVSATDGYLMVRPPDMKSLTEGSIVQLPKAYAKKRVHLPLFERAITPAVGSTAGEDSPHSLNGEPQCAIKFHRLYGDRPVRPFMMSATLLMASKSLYQRKVAFQPPLVIHNLTAAPLEYCLATPGDWTPATDGVNNPSTSVNLGWEDCQQRLRERGIINVAESLTWHLCDWDTPLELQVRIKGFEWSEPFRIVEDLPEDVYRIRLADLSSSAQLHVSAEAQTVMGRCREISLFVPYWIVNLTGLKLEYEHDDDKASYEHSTMLLAGQKRLDRDELLLKEEQSRANRHSIHSHLVRPVGSGEFSNEGVHGSKDPLPRPEIGNTPAEDQPRRHPGLIPSIPPIKGLLDLLPRPIDDSRVVGQLEVLQACHSSSHPERGCVRIRVNELDRRIGSGIGESASKNWTDSIVLDQPGTSGELEATDFSLDRVYSIGYSISTAKGRYSRTKVIMLTPRFMIINTMDASVEVCHSSPRSLPGVDEQGAGSVVSALNPALHLESGGYADFHWSLPFARSKTIRCRLAEPGWSWSGAVPLGEAREYVVRMRNDSTRATRLVRVVLKVDGPCVCVYLREENSSAPPYRIENYSLETFRIHQHSVRRSEILLPHHSLDYAWDEPTQDRVLVVDMLPSAAGDNSRPLRIGSFILDKIYRFPDGLGGTLGIEITADGPTRVLRFTDTRIRAAGGIDASGNASATEAKETKMARAFPYKYLSQVAFELLVQLQGVGVSIIDNSPRELVYVSFTGLNLEMFVSDGDDDADKSTGAPTSRFAREQHPKVVAMRFQMRDFQIDNQLPVTPYPVLLRFSNPSARTRVIDGKVVNVPVVDVQLVKHDGYAGIDFIRHFNLRVLPLHVRVDGSLLYQLLPVFVHSPVSTGRDPASGVGRGWDVSKFSQATILLDEYNASLEVGVEILDVMREDGTASVLASSSTITDRETVHSHHGDHRSMSTITTHANHHGRLVSRAEAKKLYFEEFHVDPIRATVSFSFGVSVGAMVEGLNSWTDAGRNPPATVGPLRLIINAIGTSLAKIANAPFHLKAITIGHSFIQPDALASRLVSHYQSEALRQAYVILGSVDVFGNPMVAWRNLRSGFQDFINEPVHGISKSPTEFALGMGRGTYSLVRASVYTLLDFFARILAASSLGLSEACLKLDEYTGYPATHNIYQGFAQGISGIVVSPIRAVEMSGVRGVIPGVFAGVFGFVLKPVLGVSLAAANTVATLRDAIDPNTKALLMRARPPRHIDVRTRRLKVYSYVESFGEEMVGKLRGGRYRSDGYVGHVDLKQKCFVVTRKRILYVDVKAGQKYEVLWELQADEVVLVEWHPTAEDSKMTLYFIEEDYTPRRRAVLMTKGMFMSKHVVPLPENRVLFVRAMLQQQERSLFVEAINAQAATSILPSQLKQRSLSLDQLSTWQTHFPSEYPMFKLPALAATKSMANVQPLGSTTPSTAEPPTPSSLETKGSFNLGHEITQVVEEDVPGDGDAEDHD